MKKINIILLILLCFFFVGCNSSDKDPCANGHSWQDATFTTPRTCSVCGKTDGVALGQNYTQLEKALNELKQNNFTSSSNISFSMIASSYQNYEVVHKVNGNVRVMELTSNGETGTIYFKTTDTSLAMWEKAPGENNWEYGGTLDNEDQMVSFMFMIYFNFLPIITSTEDMFTLNNNVWTADTSILLEHNTDLFMPFIQSDCSVLRYDVELNELGKVNKIYFDLLMYGEYVPNVYTFTNIGSTEILDNPEKEETYEQLQNAIKKAISNYTANATIYDDMGDVDVTVKETNDKLFVNYEYEITDRKGTMTIYKETENNESNYWIKTTDWELSTKTMVEIFLTAINYVPLFIPDSDMFTFENYCWVGDVKKIKQNYPELFALYEERYLTLSRYDIDLDNDGNLYKIYFELTHRDLSTTSVVYTFRDLGQTIIERPSDLPE